MKPTCLETAAKIVDGDRRETYGHPAENHACTAEMVTAFLRRKYPDMPTLEAEDICWFNILQKASREAHRQTDDGLIDICGYSRNIELVRERARDELEDAIASIDDCNPVPGVSVPQLPAFGVTNCRQIATSSDDSQLVTMGPVHKVSEG